MDDAGTARTGAPALDVRLTGYGDYDARFFAAISIAWRKHIKDRSWLPARSRWISTSIPTAVLIMSRYTTPGPPPSCNFSAGKPSSNRPPSSLGATRCAPSLVPVRDAAVLLSIISSDEVVFCLPANSLHLLFLRSTPRILPQRRKSPAIRDENHHYRCTDCNLANQHVFDSRTQHCTEA